MMLQILFGSYPERPFLLKAVIKAFIPQKRNLWTIRVTIEQIIMLVSSLSVC